MKCEVPMCRALVSGHHCTDHGWLCEECGMPRYPESRKLCFRCDAKSQGILCADCTSPWVYLPSFDDDKWRCRSCISTRINDKGLDLIGPAAVEWLKAKDEEHQKILEERKKRNEEIAEVVKAKRQKKKPEQSEALFKKDEK